MQSKLRIAAQLAFVLAGICWLSETVFYGGMDADGVLQESLFLPLTFILTCVGAALLFIPLFVRKR